MFITILSYCDTEVKKNQLRELLFSIKEKLPDCKTLVYSHYVNVEPEYYSLSDYYIFDKSNPKSPKSFVDWVYVGPQQKKFHRVGGDWGFAVLQMIKRSIIYLKGIGVKESFFLNYDCDPDDICKINNIQIQNLIKEDYYGIFSLWGDENNSFSLIDFFLKIDRVTDEFLNFINQDYYNLIPSNIIPENFWKSIILKSMGNNFVVYDFNIRSKISLATRALPLESNLRKYFDTILPTTDLLTREKCIATWNNLLAIDKITFQINGVTETYYNSIQLRNHSFFCKLNQSEISSITVVAINDESVEPYIIDGLSDEYWSNNYHTH